MYQKPFHDARISALGMGGFRFPTVPGNPNRIDREKAQKLIDLAIDGGINYFDTAHMYQNTDSERFLGEALSKYPRNSYYLASKFHADAGPDIAAVFEAQLRRCQTDFFDFYLLHSLDENSITDYMEKDYLAYLLEQKRAGRIRYIGFSSHAAPAALEQFLDWYDGFDMALLQINYLDWTMLDAAHQYELVTSHGIPIWVMEPLKGGRLSTLNEDARRILKKAAPERSISSWGMRYLMRLPNIQTILSGMAAPQQIADNLATFDHPDPLNDDELAVLEQAISVFWKDLGIPCSACRYCCNTCPASLDIPLLIKGYNEKRISGQSWRVGELLQTKGPDACLHCGTCLPHCPQKINIPEIMGQFAQLLETE